MELIKIKGIASKFSETIAKILDIDVMIVDAQYRRIADTFHYVKELTPIERYSILGEVMNSGKVIVVQDKTIYKHCKVCKDLRDCKISGMIGVPIFYDEKVIGAISLLIPIDKTSPIFDNLPNSIDFLEKMSDLLSSKLKNFDDYEKLDLIKKSAK